MLLCWIWIFKLRPGFTAPFLKVSFFYIIVSLNTAMQSLLYGNYFGVSNIQAGDAAATFNCRTANLVETFPGTLRHTCFSFQGPSRWQWLCLANLYAFTAHQQLAHFRHTHRRRFLTLHLHCYLLLINRKPLLRSVLLPTIKPFYQLFKTNLPTHFLRDRKIS